MIGRDGERSVVQPPPFQRIETGMVDGVVTVRWGTRDGPLPCTMDVGGMDAEVESNDSSGFLYMVCQCRLVIVIHQYLLNLISHGLLCYKMIILRLLCDAMNCYSATLLPCSAATWLYNTMEGYRLLQFRCVCYCLLQSKW